MPLPSQGDSGFTGFIRSLNRAGVPNITIILWAISLLALLSSWAFDQACGSYFVIYLAVIHGAVGAMAMFDLTSQFGKLPDGRLTWWSWVIFGPYICTLMVFIFVRRLFSKEPQLNEIYERWVLGGYPTPGSEPKWTAVVDCTAELPRLYKIDAKKVKCIPTYDTTAAWSVSDFERAVEWAVDQWKGGETVYVHCAYGHGRSAAFMAACFVMAGIAKNFEDAERQMQRCRPQVKLNMEQKAFLSKLRKTVL
uniref:Tyrosine specific protein phosphatases domain-containing protein n=1 Tax=Palpitomonas bilix TaxID=652834 RepID=A0A7S3GL14_9EUKA|mmetsp:Transcript_790/g.1429  ORF Transcript_790/g.1429 Transcript_790/m.1429 type:complete len:251 (+) Transcript_790:86-838(+)